METGKKKEKTYEGPGLAIVVPDGFAVVTGFNVGSFSPSSGLAPLSPDFKLMGYDSFSTERKGNKFNSNAVGQKGGREHANMKEPKPK